MTNRRPPGRRQPVCQEEPAYPDDSSLFTPDEAALAIRARVEDVDLPVLDRIRPLGMVWPDVRRIIRLTAPTILQTGAGARPPEAPEVAVPEVTAIAWCLLSAQEAVLEDRASMEDIAPVLDALFRGRTSFDEATARFIAMGAS